MKPLYSLIMVLIYTTVVQSQIQSIIGNTGGEFKNSEFTIEFTLGETMINTYSNNRQVITQGFHQPDIFLSTSIVSFDDLEFELNTYPNPFHDQFTITVKGENLPKMIVELVDINGRSILNKKLTGYEQDMLIDVSTLISGVYILKYTDETNRIITTEKLLKLN